jgi:multidrug efflux pump subunit AcrB
MMVLYLVLVGVTVVLFRQIPGGFVPGQDKQYRPKARLNRRKNQPSRVSSARVSRSFGA